MHRIAPLTLATALLLAAPALAQPAAPIAELPTDAAERAELLESLNRFNRRRGPTPDASDPAVQQALAFAEQAFVEPVGRRGIRDELDQAALRVANRVWLDTPLDQLTAHPAADRLFGETPADAPRVDADVPIDTSIDRWHSTGLYAAPGETVTVTVPDALVGMNPPLRVRLSGHTDAIARRDGWLRPPLPISVAVPLDEATVSIGSRFGGAVYLDFGRNRPDVGTVTVHITNTVEAPIFQLGRHTNAQWVRELRNRPAPYAELVGQRCILSVPSSHIRDVDDALSLVRYWDRVVQLHDQIGDSAEYRTSPERINLDVQISAGLYHAGYPTQGPASQPGGLTDLAHLTERGSWGWFHEMGHEAQRRPDTAWGWNNPYTFDGSIEVTVNFFSSHAAERIGVNVGGWNWVQDAAVVAERARAAIDKGGYQAGGAGEKLAMHLQLRHAFGWEPFQTVLGQYNEQQDNAPDTLPRDDAAKRDLWCVRMSQAVRRNLVPFMRDLWQLPITEEAAAQVEHLPVWMPEGFAAE